MKTIKLFGLALKGNNFDYNTLAEKGLQVGYIIDKDCSTKEVYDYLNVLDINTKGTFYKTWQDITSKNRFELFIDQVLHYMSTYGTNHEGSSYISNDRYYEKPIVNFEEFKYIKSATQEEILERADDLLSSGIALNQETIDDVFEIYDRFNYVPDIDKIKNKEAKMKIAFQKNIYPREPEEFVRFLIYVATGNLLLIKDRKTIENIKVSGLDISDYVTTFGYSKLASVFYRFKPLFLAFKKANRNNKKTINYIRKLAIKYHQPYKPSFWEDVLNNPEKWDRIPEKTSELNNFKKISLIESINERMSEKTYNSYVIRNGKFWIEENKKEKRKELGLIKNYLYNSLINSIKENHKGKIFYIPNHLDIKLPKSEKTFIGNIPLGTEVILPKKDLIVGINWKENEGTQDFDLSFLDDKGSKIGWDSDFYNDEQSIVYSGDMTSADPEATELIYFGRNPVLGMVNINRFSGIKNSLFTFFVAKENIKRENIENYMVQKENILFQTKLTSTQKQQILGVKTEDRFIIQNIKASNKRVSNGNSITEAYLQDCFENQSNKLSLRTVLKEAGLEDYNDIDIERYKEKPEIDLDFSDIQKDDIINLLN